MAGQTPSRRQLLQAFACASLASGAPGFVRWGFAFAPEAAEGAGAMQHHNHGGHEAPAATQAHTRRYRPVFFSPAEYATVQVLAELILPRTGAAAKAAPAHAVQGARPMHAGRVASADAGATDAGVAEFIDFMVSADARLQEPFRQGLVWMDGAAAPKTFAALDGAAQTALLTRLAFHEQFRADDKPGQEFFKLMRRYTVMGFYTTKIGLEQLNYPGLQFYGESPSVPQDGSLDRILRA